MVEISVAKLQIKIYNKFIMISRKPTDIQEAKENIRYSLGKYLYKIINAITNDMQTLVQQILNNLFTYNLPKKNNTINAKREKIKHFLIFLVG